MIKKYLVITLLLSITGCSSKSYSVTYNTSPKGAQLFCNGQAEGYTPVTIYYGIDEKTKKRGYVKTAPCSVKWVSGAIGHANNTFDLSKFPNGVMTTIARPNVKGYRTDAEFALKVQSLKAQQAQARAVKSAVDQMNRPITCTRNGDSTVICY